VKVPLLSWKVLPHSTEIINQKTFDSKQGKLTRTLVEKISLSNIAFTQSDSLTNLWALSSGNIHRQNSFEVSSLREGVLGVVHDAVVVVRLSKRVHILVGELIEIVLLTGHDVDFVDDHVVFAVRALLKRTIR
jgi:hypothetical protein